MKRHLLDTAPLAAYLQKREPAVTLIRPLIQKHEVATSVVVYAEVTEYIRSHPKFHERHYELRQQHYRGTIPFLPHTVMLNGIPNWTSSLSI